MENSHMGRDTGALICSLLRIRLFFFIRLSRPDLDKSTIITAPNRTVPHILSVTDFHISLQKDTLCAAYLIYSTN